MLFVTGAAFFSLAALSRQMAPVYVGVVIMVLGYLVLSTRDRRRAESHAGRPARSLRVHHFDVSPATGHRSSATAIFCR